MATAFSYSSRPDGHGLRSCRCPFTAGKNLLHVFRREKLRHGYGKSKDTEEAAGLLRVFPQRRQKLAEGETKELEIVLEKAPQKKDDPKDGKK